MLLIPDKLSGENLRNEGVPEHKIKFVDNIMIDTLEANRGKASILKINKIIQDNVLETDRAQAFVPKNQKKPYSFPPQGESGSSVRTEEKVMPKEVQGDEGTLVPGGGHAENNYAVLTMHRPSNVDTKEILEPILTFLTNEVASDMPIIWPIHPRTQTQLKEFGLWEQATTCENLILLHPIGYHEMLRLNMDARIMLTDSGGLQEEACVLGTPCLTLREHGGASVLVGNNVERIRKEYQDTLALERKPQRPELWDGKTAMRCVEAIVNTSESLRVAKLP